MKRDWLEILAGLLVLEAALWTEGRLQRELSGVAAAVIFALAVADDRGWNELGITRFGGRLGAKVMAVGAVLAGILLAVAAYVGTLHGLFGQRAPVVHALMYATWAICQEFILQSFFFLRFERLLGSTRAAVIASGLLFGFVHLPNPILMAATLGGGLLLCELFAQLRSIWPLGIAHASMGLAIALAVPAEVLRNMRVGLGYLRFHAR